MASSPLDKPAAPIETIDNPRTLQPGQGDAAMTAAPALRLGPADHGRTLTLEQFREAQEEEGYRYELARGILEVTEVPNDPHGPIVFNIYTAVARYHVEHTGVIRRFGGAGEFRLWLPTMISGRNPDFAVVLHGAPKNHRGRRGPVLVAEVVSLRGEDRDYRVKRQEYLAYGLLEYWIIDPQLRQLTLLIRDGDAWIEQVLRDDQLIPSLVLPGLAAKVSDLWVDTGDEDEDEEDNAPEPHDA